MRNAMIHRLLIIRLAMNMAHRHLAICAFIAVLLCLAPAFGGHLRRPGFEHLDHIVDHEVLAAMMALLELSEEQTAHARRLHEPYFESVRTIERDLAAFIAPHSDRVRAAQLEARKRGEYCPPEVLVEYESHRQPAIAKANHDADALLKAWRSEITLTLTEEQAARMPGVERLIRRKNLIVEDPDGSGLDFHWPVDVIDLMDKALAEGGELEHLFAPRTDLGPADAAEEVHAFESEMAAIRLAHELAIDAVLKRKQHEIRYPKRCTIEQMTPYSEDSPRNKKRARAWARLHRVRDTTVKTIASLVRDRLGEEPARLWEQRFWAEMSPYIFRDLWVIDAFELTLSSDSLTEERRTEVEQLKHDFIEQRYHLRKQTYEIGFKSASKWNAPAGAHPSQIRYTKCVIKMNEHHAQTLERLKALMPEDVRIAHDAETRRYYKGKTAMKHWLPPYAYKPLKDQ